MNALYRELADWFHLFSAPEEYAEEAAAYRAALEKHAQFPLTTLLELGSGGGNNASHLKARFECTLSDLSPEMIAISRKLNPECEHHVGDMRTLRLEQRFDAVMIHDAIVYMTTEADLRAALTNAVGHLRPGGLLLVAPDCMTETFIAGTDCGGNDAPDGSGARYLEWCWDPDPDDLTYLVDYALMVRDASGEVRVMKDRHVEGLFPRDTWLRLLREVGVDPRSEKRPDEGDHESEIFVGVKDGR
jgi:SAM-dependent methyltransferase